MKPSIFVLACLSSYIRAFAPSQTRATRTRTPHVLSAVEQASAVESFSGTGPIAVDMNQYNLGLEASAAEWTARLSTASDLKEGGAFLAAKRQREMLVDSLRIALPPRIPGQGLGMELLELAGGRQDGLGITIVSGLVEGGVAQGSGILPGDSIVKIALRLADGTEAAAVNLECLGYDSTVEAIGSLPPAADDDTAADARLVVTVKRLRRQPVVQLTLAFPPSQEQEDVTLELFAGENLRRAMLTRGIPLNDKLARRFDSGGMGDCGAEGSCATCTIQVQEGLHLLNPAGVQEAQIFTDKPQWRMACKAVVGHGMQEGSLKLRVSPRQWAEDE